MKKENKGVLKATRYKKSEFEAIMDYAEQNQMKFSETIRELIEKGLKQQ